jgi:hypothetical protein
MKTGRSTTTRRRPATACTTLWTRSCFPTCPISSRRLGISHHRKVVISHQFNSKQQAFLDFVLSHYVAVGVDELDQEKLTPLLCLQYHDSIADTVADLGRPDEIGRVFSGFQKYLYEQAA